MEFELSSSFGIIVDIAIILFLIGGIIVGYKKGFFENTVRLIGDVISIVLAYLLKNPLSVFLYTNLPFFPLSGKLEGVTVINVIIYELISFIIIWVIISIILAILAKIFKLERLALTIVTKLRIPNKILGIVIGFVESYLFVYFLVLTCMFVANFNGYDMNGKLATYVFETPLLHKTFSPAYSALVDITAIAEEYENSADKINFNADAVDILLKYGLVTQENIDLLIEEGKIQIQYFDENGHAIEYERSLS